MTKQFDPEGLKEYRKVNGCSLPLSKAQIVTIVLLVVTVVLGVSLIPQILKNSLPILYVLTAFNYSFLIFSVVDYLVLVLMDPADPRLKDPTYKRKNEKLQFCKECEAFVDIVSYHCKICKRCVEEFDHHYPFLNNCIGKQNYRYFFKLLLQVDMYTGINLGIGIWLAFHSEGTIRWVAIIYSGLSLIIFVQTAWLAAYHFYISIVLKKTSLQIMRIQRKSQSPAIYPLEQSTHFNQQFPKCRQLIETSKIDLDSNVSNWGDPITQNPLKGQSFG